MPDAISARARSSRFLSFLLLDSLPFTFLVSAEAGVLVWGFGRRFGFGVFGSGVRFGMSPHACLRTHASDGGACRAEGGGRALVGYHMVVVSLPGASLACPSGPNGLRRDGRLPGKLVSEAPFDRRHFGDAGLSVIPATHLLLRTISRFFMPAVPFATDTALVRLEGAHVVSELRT